MRRRPSPATLIACLALFFSLGGAGLAASRYLITSTSQIEPRVIRSLQSAAFYTVTGRSTQLAVQNPDPRATAHCSSGDEVVAGGFTGYDALVNRSSAIASNGPARWLAGWQVVATLAPAATRGVIAAIAVCESHTYTGPAPSTHRRP